MSEPQQAIWGLALLGRACRVGVTQMGTMLANTELPRWPSAAFSGAYLLGFATGLLGLGFVQCAGHGGCCDEEPKEFRLERDVVPGDTLAA